MPQSKDYLMDAKKFIALYGKNLSLEGVEKAILCFSPATAKKLQMLYKGKRIYSLGSCWDIYTENKSVVISHIGIGAPAALMQFEYLKAFNIPLVFSLGAIASLDKNLKLGQQLFIHQAYNEEISYLYERSNASSKKQRSANLKKRIIKNLHKKESDKLMKDLSLLPITSVSCNRPYKIKKENYQFYVSHNFSALEMEAFALMFAGKQSQMPVFCLAVVSDFLDESNWKIGFSHKKFKNSLFALLEKLLFYSL